MIREGDKVAIFPHYDNPVEGYVIHIFQLEDMHERSFVIDTGISGGGWLHRNEDGPLEKEYYVSTFVASESSIEKIDV